jgi:hypothetical protein
MSLYAFPLIKAGWRGCWEWEYDCKCLGVHTTVSGEVQNLLNLGTKTACPEHLNNTLCILSSPPRLSAVVSNMLHNH